MSTAIHKTAKILLVEDNPADVLLMREAFTSSTIVDQINVVVDGEEALDYLRKENQFTDAITPDIILLDINLQLRRIPIIVLSSSKFVSRLFHSFNRSAEGKVPIKPGCIVPGNLT